MNKFINAILCKDLPARDIKNANRVNLIAAVRAVTLFISSACSEYSWYDAALPITIAFLVHSAIGVAMVISFRRFLTELDEMERKIQLDALALSVGITVIIFSSYSILDKAGIVAQLSPSYLIMIMGLTYMVGLIVGRIKYA